MSDDFGAIGKKCSVNMEWIKDFFVMLSLMFLFLVVYMTERPDSYIILLLANINFVMVLFGVSIGFLDKLESLIMTIASLMVSFLTTSTELFEQYQYLSYTVLFIRGTVITAMSFSIGNLIGDWLRILYDQMICRRGLS